ncbi:hypothetical protein CC1G_11646 [Coprinopsis cinerea okayama7|uniref:Uncharacterized protein n=1 Tax=Coprinopsis cinerea (strain Okayama-7 / 130 / ATCC MYA-4618 / FGSC 9003) TaxID=240176 RepID=A8P491_COPC7|nr:hypothetical protein CC1G_11646 [Coprinopsis cinerea okayama7\|eukprot:XP_001838703.2 hypothetical protein CC1G_11646 [Coprinopsis cinerea okayama7\
MSPRPDSYYDHDEDQSETGLAPPIESTGASTPDTSIEIVSTYYASSDAFEGEILDAFDQDGESLEIYDFYTYSRFLSRNPSPLPSKSPQAPHSRDSDVIPYSSHGSEHPSDSNEGGFHGFVPPCSILDNQSSVNQLIFALEKVKTQPQPPGPVGKFNPELESSAEDALSSQGATCPFTFATLRMKMKRLPHPSNAAMPSLQMQDGQ